MRFPNGPRKMERGVALLIVLWGCTLAAITLGALASQARVEGIQAQGQSRRTEAYYAAEAGIEQAVFHLQIKDAASRWRADGRPYQLRLSDIAVSVEVNDENGKINLNLASPEQIEGLLRAAGVEDDGLVSAKNAIIGWGTAGKKEGVQGLAQGGFASIEEIYRIPGLDHRMIQRIEPALSLWSPQQPNLAHASTLVVAAVTGATAEASSRFVDAVRAMGPFDRSFPSIPGNASGSMADATSGFYTITSRATVGGGQTLTLNATLLLKSDPGDPRTYRVLRWRELSTTGDT